MFFLCILAAMVPAFCYARIIDERVCQYTLKNYMQEDWKRFKNCTVGKAQGEAEKRLKKLKSKGYTILKIKDKEANTRLEYEQADHGRVEIWYLHYVIHYAHQREMSPLTPTENALLRELLPKYPSVDSVTSKMKVKQQK